MCTINRDDYDAEHGMRKGPGQQAGREQIDTDGCVLYPTRNREKAGR